MNVLSKVLSAFSPAGQATDAVSAVTGLIQTIHPVLTPAQKIQAQQFTDSLAVNRDQVNATLSAHLADAAAGDTASARARQIALHDRVTGFLAVSVTVGFFGLLIAVCRWAVPEANRTVIDVMLGALGTAWITIIGFYFGSSLSSATHSFDLQQSMQRVIDIHARTLTGPASDTRPLTPAPPEPG